VLPEVLRQIAGALQTDAIVASLAPKFTVAKLSALLGGFDRIARIIPNAPSIVGRGFNPVAFGPSLTADDRSLLKRLLDPLGASPEVAENLLEAYAVITAMGPTYLWPQLIELTGLAQSFGLSRAEAIAAVRQMVDGAAATLVDSGLPADEVLDLVPVRPLSEYDATFREAYRTKLTAIMEKIRP
jgi:pyrroline-5-carboxylate reductase